jgi:hypothetical protein
MRTVVLYPNSSKQSLYLSPVSVDLLIGLLLNPEAGSDMFLRNVVLSRNYRVLQPGRQYSR